MRSLFVRSACAIVVASSICQPASAGTVYSLSGDFSATNNPNGVWAYGDSTTVGGALNPYTAVTTTGLPFDVWGDTSAAGWGTFFVPSVFYNPSSSTATSGTVQLPGHGVSLHPGQDGTYSVVQFTAPSSGDYLLSFNFTSADTNSNPPVGATADYVLVNGMVLESGHIQGPVGTDSFGGSGIDLILTKGETVDFVVGQYQGQFYYDSTQVSATLDSVPEASTWAMILLGFVGVVFAGRRASRRFTGVAG